MRLETSFTDMIQNVHKYSGVLEEDNAVGAVKAHNLHIVDDMML